MKPRYIHMFMLLNHLSNKHHIVHFIQNKKEDQSPLSKNLEKKILSQDALSWEVSHLTQLLFNA